MASSKAPTANSLWHRQAHAGINGLSLLISLLALIATGAGIFTANSQHHRVFTAVRGDTVSIQGAGLYANESVSGAAQAIGQDALTMVFGIPLLLVASYLASRGSLRGQLLRAGALGYFAYTYVLMAFGGAFNQLFPIYVALYSASIFALVLSVMSIDGRALRTSMSPRFARRLIAWLLIGFGSLLALLWLGRILPSITSSTPPPGLDSYSTLFVQAGDLGLVVPIAIVSGVLLLRRRPIGYLLAGVVLVKAATFGLALVAMMVSMAIAGVVIAPVEAAFFGVAAIVFGVATVHFISSVPRRAPSATARSSNAIRVAN